ncbi:Cell morphogenesis protein PAG1 [Linum perenne]
MQVQSQKSRREELRVHIANIYRTVAENIWPGMLNRKPVFRLHYLRFIDDTTRQILTSPTENFQEMQPLRYALASVIRFLAPEFVDSKSEKFDLRTRKRLFDLLLSWSDDNTASTWVQDGASDYRREVERYKASQHYRSKDSVDKISFDKDLSDQIEAIQWASMNAMASLLYGPCFDDNARKMSGRLISWINSLFNDPAPRAPFGYSPTPSHSKYTGEGTRGVAGRDRHRGSHHRVALAKLALKNLLLTNLDLFPACIDQCYHSDAAIADGYFSVLAEVYMRQEIPKCEIQRLLSLILYKVVDPNRQIRDDALQMLETLSVREWAEDGFEGSGGYRAAVVGNLPDSYQQFQYKLSCKLAKDHPELSQLLCEEIMLRQLDAVDIIAQHQVLTCMAPWIENLNFWKLKDSGWSERLLKSLYYVTSRHGNQFPDEIEKLWSTIANKARNISPVLDFLITKGIEDCDSNASAEISGAFATYFSVAKRVSLYLARICPQRTIDHLVYQLAQRMSEDSIEHVGPSVTKGDPSGSFVLEFSQGPGAAQIATVADVQPHMSPLLVRGSLEGPLRNSSGSLSWRTAGATGRSVSGPLSPMPPELNVVPVTAGRSGQLLPALVNMSGPLMGVRSSTGSLRSRHVSRDSGDYLIDTPNSGEDGLLPPVGMHGVNAKELQSALQGHQQHSLTHADIALILLAEIAYENDEDFREHLPLLFHVTFVSMDSSEDIVLEHCQHLLVNLLYSLAGKHLELYEVENSDGENKQQVVSLIKYVQSKRGGMMWENEDPSVVRPVLPSAALLSALVQSMVDAIFFQGDLRETWGTEALKWAMECTSRHLACRSHQIYRALRPSVTSDTCVSLLRCLHRCLINPVPPVLGFVMEILLTLQVMVENMEPEKVILYPQLFWGCVAMMHTDFIHVYCQVLELFSRVIDRLSFRDRTTENVLLSSMPRDELDTGGDIGDFQRVESLASSSGSLPTFEGVQPLVLKGLMSTVSHDISIEVLSRITVHSCDSIFGDGETRLLMHITGLLPWLCLQFNKDVPGVSPPLHQPSQKACSVANNIALWCRAKSLDELAIVFMAYARGEIKSIENLLACVSPLLCAEWFPKHSTMAFGHLLRLLERGPAEYQRVILLMLKALLQHTPMDASQSPHMYAIVSQLVESTLCWEALSVLEALLQSCSSLPGGSHPHDSGSSSSSLHENGSDDKVSGTPQTSFKGRSGPLQYGMGSGLFAVGTSAFGSQGGGGTETGVPAREVALQNTRLILGRVLDNCALGRRRDYKRLVPFVNNISS